MIELFRTKHGKVRVIQNALSAFVLIALIGIPFVIISRSPQPRLSTTSPGLTGEQETAPDSQPTANQVQASVETSPEPQIIELPFGGTTVLDTHSYVALYGSPKFAGLGALGEQSLEESVVRINNLVAEYQPLTDRQVTPMFEIITTVASASPTENNDYSQEIDVETIRPWVQSAKENNIYVILDLQPGRSTFLQQAKLYEELLKEPHVSLALDPEWRLLTQEARHLVKVGSVHASEVNETSQWLADLVAQHNLPQKIFMVHQFKPQMVQARETLDTSRAEELAYVIHMDGHGTLGQKRETWNRTIQDLPNNTHMAWKNFYDEDLPTPTPEQTMQQIPEPTVITYQ